jgi:hypothetical protein
MKKCLFSLLMLFMIATADAQFGKIPSAVTDSMKARYADASNVSWRFKLTGGYEADFKLGDQQLKAEFTSEGNWVKTEQRYALDNLPAPVKEGYRKSKYTDWEVENVVKIENKEEGKYGIVIRKGTMLFKRYLLFSSSGQLLSDAITI